MVSNEHISTVAKLILLLGIVGIHFVVPMLGVVTVPIGLIAGLWLFWKK